MKFYQLLSSSELPYTYGYCLEKNIQACMTLLGAVWLLKLPTPIQPVRFLLQICRTFAVLISCVGLVEYQIIQKFK